jgi:hypothetical protein
METVCYVIGCWLTFYIWVGGFPEHHCVQNERSRLDCLGNMSKQEAWQLRSLTMIFLVNCIGVGLTLPRHCVRGFSFVREVTDNFEGESTVQNIRMEEATCVLI